VQASLAPTHAGPIGGDDAETCFMQSLDVRPRDHGKRTARAVNDALAGMLSS